MANMATTQTELLKQLADMQEKFATMAAASAQTMNTTPIRRGGGGMKQQATAANGRNNPGNKDPKGYCWTHGYNVAHGHSSVTCRNQATGHKTTAVRNDNQGGAQAGKPDK